MTEPRTGPVHAPRLDITTIGAMVDEIKQKPIGRFYVRHIKKHARFHNALRWLVNTLSPIYIRIYCEILFRVEILVFNRDYAKWRSLVAQGDAAGADRNGRIVLAAASSVPMPRPVFYPDDEPAITAAPYLSYDFPEIYVSQIGDAIVHGRSNLVITDTTIVHHDLYNFIRDATSEELHLRAIVGARRRRARWIDFDLTPEHLPAAATFLDACAFNYAHWMTEVLPRIAMFCADPRFADIPLLIDAGHHANIMESLRVVAGPERRIIALQGRQGLRIDRLYATSVAGYIPFGRRNERLPWSSQGRFSPLAIERMVGALRTAYGADVPPDAERPHLYIRRNSGVRKVANDAEIEAMLMARGFTIVEPERLTLAEQVRLFSSARTLIGSSGAALANILFLPRDADIFVLMSSQPNNIYYYWHAIACVRGKRAAFVLGTVAPGRPNTIHADFTIDPARLATALDAGSATGPSSLKRDTP